MPSEMYFDEISDFGEWIEVGTKIDLFHTSDNEQIINNIRHETITTCQQNSKKELKSPKKKNNTHPFKENFQYLCQKLEIIRKRRMSSLNGFSETTTKKQ